MRLEIARTKREAIENYEREKRQVEDKKIKDAKKRYKDE